MAWMKNPKPVYDIDSVPELDCGPYDPDSNCPTKENFRFDSANNIPPELFEVYMNSCAPPKPPYFPWLNNPEGLLDIPIPPGST